MLGFLIPLFNWDVNLTESIEIRPCQQVSGQIRPPGSKSLTNRALVCAALADSRSILHGALNSEDTQVMVESLRALGIGVRCDWARQQIEVDGCSGEIPCDQADLFVANSGTTIRFLTALCCLGHGRYRLSGIPRMHERPIAALVDGLRQVGAIIETENEGCPPVRILGRGLRGGSVNMAADISSQFASGLLMALPYAEDFSVLQLQQPVISKPYIDMTCSVMNQFGVEVTRLDDFFEYSVDPNQIYDATEFEVEPDASAASYFWAAAAVTRGRVKVLGLTSKSLQGDVRFVKVLEKMGCEVSEDDSGIELVGGDLKGIDVDMSEISDTAQTLAVVALFAEGPTRIQGIAHNRVKETDRIGNLAKELRRLGAEVTEFDDDLEIHPPDQLAKATIKTYNDHRMAMSFSIAGLREAGIKIGNPECVAKTYPEFFKDFSKLCET